MIKVWMAKHSLKKNKNIHFLAQPNGYLLAKLYGRNPEERASFHKPSFLVKSLINLYKDIEVHFYNQLQSPWESSWIEAEPFG